MSAHATEVTAIPESNDPVRAWERRLFQVREATEELCAGLEPEDFLLQSMPDASPVKWHLAHTTWFFETFVLAPHLPEYPPFHPRFSFLFNSYYNAIGPRWTRAERGLLARPTTSQIFAYREYVDAALRRLLDDVPTQPRLWARLAEVIEMGIHHEQQHQELLLTDLKHAYGASPLAPVYRAAAANAAMPSRRRWMEMEGGIVELGFEGERFAYDNERPRHQVYLQPHQIARRPVTSGEFLAFIDDQGYQRPELWLSDGWTECQRNQWRSPLYWMNDDSSGWMEYTLAGPRAVDPYDPVVHVSFYEADAYARWAEARLPTEAEWEHAAGSAGVGGHFLDSGNFHPISGLADDDSTILEKLYGDVWQWTASPYVGYPGYQPPPGALGEYNGKFMCNQMVLRGASCATPRSHARRTYRNFFPPHARWQFSGIRLARDVS
jgi:ergothioneine biosynthesis protein EgtB